MVTRTSEVGIDDQQRVLRGEPIVTIESARVMSVKGRRLRHTLSPILIFA